MGQVIVRISSQSLGSMEWKLPHEIPKGVMTQEDADAVGMMLKPHLRWIITMLLSGLIMGAKSKEWFARLRKMEERHNLEVLEITLS